jgi:hypothetical protein
VGTEYVAVRVKNHPARVTVYNLHLPECRWAKSGDPIPSTLEDYAVGDRITRSAVPAHTGWVFGRGSAGGDPDAPVWITDDSLSFTCGHCLRRFRVP